MGLFSRKNPPQPSKPPSPGSLTPEQIAEDMKRYARQNPYRGNLHELDAEEARERWKRTRFGEIDGENGAGGEGRAAAAGAVPEAQSAAERRRAAIRPCIEHPEAAGAWCCADCGSNFCDRCVRPLLSYFNTAHGGYEHRSGVCPRCKGRCIDLRFEAEKRKRIESREAEKRRGEAFRRTMLAVLTIQFVAGALYRCRQATLALDLQYMLFVFGMVQYGPLRNIGIVTKSYFIRVLPPALLANAGSYLVAGSSGSGIAHVLFLTPVKYLGISLLLYGGVRTVEKTADLIGHVYKGSQEPPGWTRFDRVCAGLSLAIIVLSVLSLLVTSIIGILNILVR